MKLRLELKLERNDLIQGESARFAVTLFNEDAKPAENLQTFEPRNESLRLMVGIQLEGSALGMFEREGTGPRLVHWHPKLFTLGPGKKESQAGDLLQWIGALPVGEHTLRAEYDPGEVAQTTTLVSSECRLTIRSAQPTFCVSPRLPEMGIEAPAISLWRNKADADAKWFVAQHSRVLPPNPYSCFAIDKLPPTVTPLASVVPAPWPMSVQLCWIEGGALIHKPVSLYAQDAPKPGAAPLPFAKGLVLDPPATVREDQLVALVADEARKQLVLIHAGDKGGPRITPLDIGGRGPLGPYAVHWTYDERLAFAWAAEDGKELYFANLPWTDPADAFAPRAVATVGGKLLRVDLSVSRPLHSGEAEPYLDGGPGETFVPEPRPGPHVPPEPTHTIYALLSERAPRRLTIAAYGTRLGNERILTRLSIPDGAAGELECVGSIMTRRAHPVYLLRDAADRHFFASTLENMLLPVDGFAGEPVGAGQFPMLTAASARSDVAWVYLRYFSQRAGAFVFTKLEPKERADGYSLKRQRVASLRWY